MDLAEIGRHGVDVAGMSLAGFTGLRARHTSARSRANVAMQRADTGIPQKCSAQRGGHGPLDQPLRQPLQQPVRPVTSSGVRAPAAARRSACVRQIRRIMIRGARPEIAASSAPRTARRRVRPDPTTTYLEIVVDRLTITVGISGVDLVARRGAVSARRWDTPMQQLQRAAAAG